MKTCSPHVAHSVDVCSRSNLHQRAICVGPPHKHMQRRITIYIAASQFNNRMSKLCGKKYV
jgi:hypothetical protein